MKVNYRTASDPEKGQVGKRIDFTSICTAHRIKIFTTHRGSSTDSARPRPTPRSSNTLHQGKGHRIPFRLLQVYPCRSSLSSSYRSRDPWRRARRRSHAVFIDFRSARAPEDDARYPGRASDERRTLHNFLCAAFSQSIWST